MHASVTVPRVERGLPSRSRRELRAFPRSHTMSLVASLLLVALASALGLILAMALARAVLHANVLTELDRSARWLAPAARPRYAGSHFPAPRARRDRPARRRVRRDGPVSV